MDSLFCVEERGQLYTTSYKIYFKNKNTNNYISPFHDIPLVANKQNNIFNAIIEIPRWSNAKMEINKTEKLNPIMQDVKNNRLRFVHNIFPYHGYLWNYGAFPQTWEDPNVRDDFTGYGGDDDPLDLCEIGSKIQKRGAVIQIKVLGALGLIDEGEADWKIIGIDQNDPMANRLHRINDVNFHLPGLLDASLDWFRIYKVPSGKPENKFAGSGKFFDKEFALRLIQHHHESWLNLVKGGYDFKHESMKHISLLNESLSFNKSNRIEPSESTKIVQNESEEYKPEPASLENLFKDQSFFIKRK